MSIDFLKKQQSEVLAKAQAVNEFAMQEGRDLTSSEKSEFDTLLGEVENFNTRIQREESLLALAEKYKPVSSGRILKPARQEHETNPGEIHNEIEGFSIVKAVGDMLAFGRVKGLEAEVSQEIAKRKGVPAQGFYIPNRTAAKKFAQDNYADLTTGGGGSGAISNMTDYPDFIELLRNKCYVVKLGARMINGIKGNLLLPRQSAAASTTWSSGDSASSITASAQAINQVSLPQKTLGAATVYSRALLHQVGNFDVEQFVRDDLMKVLAVEIDRAVLAGSGSGVNPTGILYDSTNNNIVPAADSGNGGALAYNDIVNFEQQLAVNNVENDDGTFAFITTPKLRSELKTTAKIGSTFPVFVWDDNQMIGYPSYVSNNMPSNLTKGSGTNLQSLILAKWSEVVIGTWGDGIDVIVNPYALDISGSGAVRVVTLVDTNFCFRHSGAFSRCVSAT